MKRIVVSAIRIDPSSGKTIQVERMGLRLWTGGGVRQPGELTAVHRYCTGETMK